MLGGPLAILFALVGFSNCDKGPSTPQAHGETVIFNVRIYTVNEAQPWAEAIHVKGGVIDFVGSFEEAMALASDSAVEVDLEGDFIMLGIHDVHLHPLEAATSNFQFLLDDSVQDPKQYSSGVAQAI